MILMKIAMMIFMIVLVMYLATRAFSVFFLLFSFRLFMMVLPEERVMGWLGSNNHFHYLLIIAVLTCLLFGLVASINRSIQHSNLLFLLVIMLVVLPKYGFSDVFLLRDYFESHGMWSLDYWINQVREVFLVGPDKAEGMLTDMLKKVIDFGRSVVDAMKKE